MILQFSRSKARPPNLTVCWIWFTKQWQIYWKTTNKKHQFKQQFTTLYPAEYVPSHNVQWLLCSKKYENSNDSDAQIVHNPTNSLGSNLIGKTRWQKKPIFIYLSTTAFCNVFDLWRYSGERKKCRIENSLFSPNQKQTKNRFFNGATERYIVSRFALD